MSTPCNSLTQSCINCMAVVSYWTGQPDSLRSKQYLRYSCSQTAPCVSYSHSIRYYLLQAVEDKFNQPIRKLISAPKKQGQMLQRKCHFIVKLAASLRVPKTRTKPAYGAAAEGQVSRYEGVVYKAASSPATCRRLVNGWVLRSTLLPDRRDCRHLSSKKLD